MPHKKGKLAVAGFVLVDSVRRRYRDTQNQTGTGRGRVVSYRQAFFYATGRSLEDAVRIHDKFPELHDARQIRDAARRSELSAHELLSPADERRLADTTLRGLTKGHYIKSATSAGMKAKFREDPSLGPERTSVYGKLLGLLTGQRDRPSENDPKYITDDERFDRARFVRDWNGWLDANGPHSAKADLLRAMGRKFDYEYSVGETP